MDLRVERIFQDEMKDDKSFQEKESSLTIFFGSRYTNQDMRDTWNKGIKHGIEIGLRKASLDGQIIDLNTNTHINNSRHKEFLEKFYKLSDEYNCAIQYHPEVGLKVIDKEKY